MISFERTQDYELIKSIMTHPRTWSHIADDSAPPREEFEPIQNDGIWYVLAKDDGVILGVWVFIPDNVVCWKVHSCLLPGAWGHSGQRAANLLPDWIWNITKCMRVITVVTEDNRLALKYAKRADMEEFGVNERAFLKNGNLQNLIMLGISKPVGLCH